MKEVDIATLRGIKTALQHELRRATEKEASQITEEIVTIELAIKEIEEYRELKAIIKKIAEQ